MLCALIMAGGKGSRFWPLSTEEKPKQFLNLIGEETMIQMTVNRIKSIIPIEKIFICTGKRYVDLVKGQLPELPDGNIIIEPESRNTTPCIALSALVIDRYYKNATMLVLPSDHLINNEEKFREIINVSSLFVEKNNDSIVTLGITPSRAETGYGYIKVGKSQKEMCGYEIINVENFVEKPDKINAEGYLRDGNYLWNSGMFMWSTENIINKIKLYSYKTYESLKDISTVEENRLENVINDNYHNTESISIDYSVLEKAENIYVIPSDIKWDDVGNWRALERYGKKDTYNNIVNDKVKIIESKSNMVINNEKKIIMIGLEDIMTLETDDSIFIVNKDYMEDLKIYEEII